MNERDRLIYIGVGAAVGLFIFYYVVSSWWGELARLDSEVAKAQAAVRAQEKIVDSGKRAIGTIDELKSQSLPGNKDVARAAYQTWLVKVAQDVGFSDINVNPSSEQEQLKLYNNFSFTVAARGNLRQMTNWMHRFYSIDLLHRIKRISVKPIVNTKDLDITMTIDALMLVGADATPAIVEKPGARLAHKEVQPYYDTVVARNIFAPANIPPKLARIGDQKAVVGDSVTFTAKATDADPLDTLQYSLDAGAPTGATIDPKSGKFSFRPTAVGTYIVNVRATDDGFPALPATEKITISVAKKPDRVVGPPPPPPPPGPKVEPVRLDLGKFAYVTALTDVAGKPEMWLSIRSSGELVRLYEGDEYEIAKGLKVKIREISDSEVIFSTVNKTFRVKLGEPISEAKPPEEDGI